MGVEVTRRILPREEYGRLDQTDLASQLWWMGPDVRVLVTEHDGAIVGCVALCALWHVEGLWIDPAHRGRAGVLRQLLRSLGEEGAAIGTAVVYPGAASDEMADIVTGLGAVPIPMTFYALSVQKVKSCHPS